MGEWEVEGKGRGLVEGLEVAVLEGGMGEGLENEACGCGWGKR